jgi:hypothetical protein
MERKEKKAKLFKVLKFKIYSLKIRLHPNVSTALFYE